MLLPLQAAFYVLSVAALLFGGVATAVRSFQRMTRDRLTWEASLDSIRRVEADVADIHADLRAASQHWDSIEVRIRALESR